MPYKKRLPKMPYKPSRTLDKNASDRRRHEVYRNLLNRIPPGLSPEEYAKRQLAAAKKAGI